jgi:hypothetical protein
VVIDENVFPFASLHPNVGALLKKEILLLSSFTHNSHEGAQNIDDHMSPLCLLLMCSRKRKPHKKIRAKMMQKTSSEIDVQNWPENDETSVETEPDLPRHSLVQPDP